MQGRRALNGLHTQAAEGSDGQTLFEGKTYTDFGRRAIRLRGRDPLVTLLFDSTIEEPTTELMRVVRDVSFPQASSRFVSVFADGNPFAVAALARRFGLDEAQIITTTGAISAAQMALTALLAPGDEVLVERPGFGPHPEIVAAAGGVPVSLQRRAPAYRFDLDELVSQLTPRTRALIISNLHNPSGAYLAPEEITALAQTLDAAGAVLIVDEIYADFADPPITAARLGPNVLAVSSLAKVYGLSALKFGWAAGDAAMIGRIKAATPNGDHGVSKLAHAVAAHVLEAPEPFRAHWRRVLEATRPAVVEAAETMRRAGLVEGEVPAHGCMYFPRIPGVVDTRTLARRLFEEHQVLLAPGEYFGAPGHMRIGFGSLGPAEAALKRLIDGLRSLL